MRTVGTSLGNISVFARLVYQFVLHQTVGTDCERTTLSFDSLGCLVPCRCQHLLNLERVSKWKMEIASHRQLVTVSFRSPFHISPPKLPFSSRRYGPGPSLEHQFLFKK